MFRVSQASLNDIPIIQEIAQKTWPEVYGAILSDRQFEYMMNLMYSEESLQNQFKNQHLFYLAFQENSCLGFVSCENNYHNSKVTRIHKIYILPQAQGKGIGAMLMDTVVALAKDNQSEMLSLNVNKYNKALNFYLKIGFTIATQEDIEIGNGYLMEDYRMEMKI